MTDLFAIDEVDVLVAGSGIAGISAAYEAARAGKRVLVVEADEEPGGASALSHGASCIVGTPHQSAAGIDDSVDLALADWTRAGAGADIEWARRYLADSKRDVYDWCEELGVGWQKELVQHEHNSVPRGHLPIGFGDALLTAATAAAAAAGTRVECSARVVRLVENGAQVTGAIVARGDREHRILARAVVLATGGFVNNAAMLNERSPLLRGVRRFLCGGAPQATGSGHRLLEGIGAAFAYPDVWIYPDGSPNPRDPTGQRGVLVRGRKTEIWVNERGERFHDELRTGGMSGTPALLSQPGQHCWAIFDRVAADATDLRDDAFYGRVLEPNRARVEWFFSSSAYVKKARTIVELARTLGLPASSVEREVEAFNAAVARGGIEARFGRNLRGANAIATPPFFGVEYMPTVQKNLGGVRTDLECRVLGAVSRASGAPVPCLYAVGELAGMAGGHINGSVSIENAMFPTSLYSGRVAGRAIARHLT